MVVDCNIQFDKNPNCTFISGKLVNGIITLEVDKPKDIKAVLLKLSGFADTYWTETTFDKTDSYWGHEKYLDSVIYLLRSENGNHCTLDTGRHQYTFTFQLPKECPSSFEGLNGRIRYLCNVVLVRPWKFDQTFTKAISVIKELDLNLDSIHLRKPLYAKAEKSLWSLSNSGLFTLEVVIAKSGFVSGEKIPIELIIKNESNVAVKEINASLVMIVKFYESSSHLSSTTERKIVSEIKGEGVQSYCNKVLNYELSIPATPSTSIGVCPIIEISYNVQVEAKFRGLHTRQNIDLPVTIGTVPITNDRKENEALIFKTEEPREIKCEFKSC